MQGLMEFWSASDAIGRTTAALLFLMSIGSWFLIGWKSWVLKRASADLVRGLAGFWSAPNVTQARERLQQIDREQIILPLLTAADAKTALGTLAASSQPESQLTRRIRDALHRSVAHLQWGQVVLASVASTAPFIGLFGTVWGIYHALVSLSAEGVASIDKVSGPVGEALIMTAAGLAVAIPAALAFNLFNKWINAAEAELEGFAHDLREWQTQGSFHKTNLDGDSA